MLVDSAATIEGDGWIIDSDANVHIAKHRGAFITYAKKDMLVGTAEQGGNEMKMIGIGLVRLPMENPDTGKTTYLVLSTVYHCPTVRYNIISEGFLMASGIDTLTSLNINGKRLIRPDGRLLGYTTMYKKYFFLKLMNMPVVQATGTARSRGSEGPETKLRTWHRRLAHLGYDNVKKLTDMSTGMDLFPAELKEKPELHCSECLTAKTVKRIPKTPARRATQLLELVYSDIWGPSPVIAKSDTGALNIRYFLSMIDDYSRFTRLYFLKNIESATLRKVFEYYVAWAERQSGKKLKKFRHDGGRQYVLGLGAEF